MLEKKYTLNQKFGPYSTIIKKNNFYFISGQIPINKKTGMIPQSISDQTTLTLKNIFTILQKNQLNIKNIIKITIFTTKLDKLNKINNAYQDFFDQHTTKYPARSCIGVSQLPKKVHIEIEAIASK